jgi:hypothetical protein
MTQPLGQRSDVAGQPRRFGFDLPRKLQLDDKLVVWTTRTCAVNPGLQLLAPRRGSLGETRQRGGKAFVLVLDVK